MIRFGLTLAALCVAGSAHAQIQDRLVPMPPGTDTSRQCVGVGDAFKGTLAAGQVLDRSPSRGGYALHPQRLWGQATKVENISVVEVKAYANSPNVASLIVCHARVTLLEGTIAEGKIIIQRSAGGGPIISWMPDEGYQDDED
jgi:hypothetical protein